LFLAKEVGDATGCPLAPINPGKNFRVRQLIRISSIPSAFHLKFPVVLTAAKAMQGWHLGGFDGILPYSRVDRRVTFHVALIHTAASWFE